MFKIFQFQEQAGTSIASAGSRIKYNLKPKSHVEFHDLVGILIAIIIIRQQFIFIHNHVILFPKKSQENKFKVFYQSAMNNFNDSWGKPLTIKFLSLAFFYQ